MRKIFLFVTFSMVASSDSLSCRQRNS